MQLGSLPRQGTLASRLFFLVPAEVAVGTIVLARSSTGRLYWLATTPKAFIGHFFTYDTNKEGCVFSDADRRCIDLCLHLQQRIDVSVEDFPRTLTLAILAKRLRLGEKIRSVRERLPRCTTVEVRKILVERFEDIYGRLPRVK